MRGTLGWVLALVLTGACGARSGLAVPESDEPRRDGGPFDSGAVDARPFDARPFDAGELPPDACAPIDLPLRVAPTVMLLVDQSGSMDELLAGGDTRWNTLREAVVGPAGLVTRRAGAIRFGLALYSARSQDGGEGGPPVGPCPLLASVNPMLSNAGAIRSLYRDAEPIEDTPTGDAILAVTESLVAAGEPERTPTILVLATDGEPDSCAELDPQTGQALAVDAAASAFEQGIRTFVIGVGDVGVSSAHLQDVANAGAGRAPPSDPATFWRIRDAGGLRDALDAIVEDELSCELFLAQPIDASQACRGVVRIDGRPIPCGSDDGWVATDERRVELQGAACTRVEENPDARVDAVFPCDVLR